MKTPTEILEGLNHRLAKLYALNAVLEPKGLGVGHYAAHARIDELESLLGWIAGPQEEPSTIEDET